MIFTKQIFFFFFLKDNYINSLIKKVQISN